MNSIVYMSGAVNRCYFSGPNERVAKGGKKTHMNGLLNPESQCIGTLDCMLNVLFIEEAILNAEVWGAWMIILLFKSMAVK